ncbi:MAG: signal peptide peptidase SppA [Robiginitomaculum sp.]|nr:MAG: signal peptide peptidase SppA [Robiginitomaculum sp.]
MRQFFLSLLGSIIGFFIAMFLGLIFIVAIGAALIGAANNDDSDSAGPLVLTMDLRSGMLDHGGENSIFGDSSQSVVTNVRALNRAKNDDNVKGVFIRANSWGMSSAKAEELRLGLLDFRTSGKFVIAYAQGFEGTSLSSYMSVSAADEIWLQDTTGFSIAGYRAEIEFLGGVFEKYDVKPEFIQFHEYKNAVNTYTKKALTAPHREAMTALLQSLMDTSVQHIAHDRELSEDNILAFLNDAPHSAEAAKEAGYIDTLGHYADARDYVRKKAGGDQVKFKKLSDYGYGTDTGPVIAFIGGQGAVVNGTSDNGSNPFSNKLSMGGDTISEAFIKASKDDKVKAIVFRVSSPGGSPSASDQIWDSVNKAKAAGKPVVVSMGQYAASGGYYVAANADKIVAMPTTITGSIGVYGGKIAIGDALGNFGHNVEAITIGGEYGAAHSPFEPWNQANKEAYRRSLEDIYVDFTTRVSDGRGLSIERVREIAKGRVWTGAQAKEIGLVDELGGIMKAIEVAKELAEIDEKTRVRIKKYPRDLTPGEQLEQLFNVTADAGASLEDLRILTQSAEFKTLMQARATLNQTETQLRAQLPNIK